MYRFTPALLLLALFAMPISAADQASSATESASTPAALHLQRGFAGDKARPHRGATREAAPAATSTVDPCEACKKAQRASMRGPKGGYLVPKGTSPGAIERKITEACRLACAE